MLQELVGSTNIGTYIYYIRANGDQTTFTLGLKKKTFAVRLKSLLFSGRIERLLPSEVYTKTNRFISALTAKPYYTGHEKNVDVILLTILKTNNNINVRIINI